MSEARSKNCKKSSILYKTRKTFGGSSERKNIGFVRVIGIPNSVTLVQANEKNKNSIQKILKESSEAVVMEEGIAETFLYYFRLLFHSSSPSHADIVNCIESFEPRVTADMNSSLLARYSKEEMVVTLNQMASTKSPSLDGYNARFFQHHWPAMGEDVCNTILNILIEGSMNPNLNPTYIALIPKTCNPL